MVVTNLDDKLIKDGEQLLRQLDTDHVLVDAILWFYFYETQKWKLLVSLPGIINRGPKIAYHTIQGALSKISINFSLDDVVVIQPDDPLLRLLRTVITTDDRISGIRFSNNVVNGQLIQDAYIYRVAPNRKIRAAIRPGQ
jgi:hypothetical protein